MMRARPLHRMQQSARRSERPSCEKHGRHCGGASPGPVSGAVLGPEGVGGALCSGGVCSEPAGGAFCSGGACSEPADGSLVPGLSFSFFFLHWSFSKADVRVWAERCSLTGARARLLPSAAVIILTAPKRRLTFRWTFPERKHHEQTTNSFNEKANWSRLSRCGVRGGSLDVECCVCPECPWKCHGANICTGL